MFMFSLVKRKVVWRFGFLTQHFRPLINHYVGSGVLPYQADNFLEVDPLTSTNYIIFILVTMN